MATTPQPSPPTPAGQAARVWANPWWIAVLCGMASYLDAGTIVSTSSALVLYQTPLGLSAWTIGFLSGALTLLFAAGALVGGRLADMFGRRRMFLIYLTMLLAGQAVMGVATASWMLMVGVVVMGFAIGGVLPTSLAILADEVPEQRRGTMIAFSNLLWVVGIVATIIVTTIFGSWGETCARILFLHLGVVAVVLLLAWLVAAKNVGRSDPTSAASQTKATESSAAPVSLRSQLRSGTVLVALVSTGLFYALVNLSANTFGQFGTYLYVNLAGSTIVFFSTVSLALLPLSFLLSVMAMRIASAPSRWVWFVVGAVLQLAGLLVVTIMGVSVTTLIIMAITSGFGYSFAGEVMYKVWSQEIFASELRATAQGMTIGFARFAAAGFAVITPALLNASARGFFLLILVLTAVGMAVAWIWIRPLTHRVVVDDQAVSATAPAAV